MHAWILTSGVDVVADSVVAHGAAATPRVERISSDRVACLNLIRLLLLEVQDAYLDRMLKLFSFREAGSSRW